MTDIFKLMIFVVLAGVAVGAFSYQDILGSLNISTSSISLDSLGDTGQDMKTAISAIKEAANDVMSGKLPGTK